MRYPAITFVLVILALAGTCQKQDYNWLSGSYAYPNPTYDTSFNCYWATSILDFNSNPVQVKMDSLKMNFSRTNTSYSDNDGNLLFFTNGIYIANSLDEKIENSDSLNASYLSLEWDPSIQTYGYRLQYAILAFGDVANPQRYYLLHSLGDSIPGSNGSLYYPKILSTYLDMDANMNHGKVIYKNKTVLYDSLDGIGSELAAIRHGNGRDWWVIVKKKNGDCYYKILIDQTGPHVHGNLNCGGFLMPKGQIGSACASPDGSKYVYLNTGGGVNLWDFDRCNGELSNLRTFRIPTLIDSVWWLNIGMAISPNNRFLYISATKHLYQIDLELPDPFSDIDTVGIFDGHYVKQPFLSLFKTAQLAPDGKIYISCGINLPYYHVINQPDLKGDSCDFQQHSFTLPSFSAGVPSFPNYRLGKLSDSACDTIWNSNDEETISQREKVLKVFPNPASDVVTVDYGFTDWSKSPLTPPHPPSTPSPKEKGNGKELFGGITMEIVNELGQTVHQQTLPQYSGFQRVNVSSYSAGIYTAYIKRNNQIIATSKFAKQ